MSYRDEQLALGPLLYLRLDDATGTLLDSSGNGHNGSIIGGTFTQGVAGAVPGNAATTFGGTSGYGTVPDGSWMNTAAFSIVFWFKTTTSTSPQLVNRYDNSFVSQRWFLCDMSSGAPRFIAVVGGANKTITGGSTYADGNWHMFVGTYSGSQVQLFLDNTSIGTVAATGTYGGSVATDLGILLNNREAGTGGAGSTAVALDEVAYLDYALSPTQVARLWNSVSGPSTISGTWGWVA